MAKFTADSLNGTYGNNKTVTYFGNVLTVPIRTVSIVTKADGTVNALSQDAELGISCYQLNGEYEIKWMFHTASLTQVGTVSSEEAVNWKESKQYVD